MTKIAGFYDLAGDIAEVVEIDGHFVVRFEGVPERFAPTLRPTGKNSFIVETGTMAGAEISFNGSGGLIGGMIPIERIERPDPPPWPTGKGLTLDEPDPTEEEDEAYQQLWTRIRERSDGAWITWDLPWPRHRFVEWLTRRRHVIFHGSPHSDLELFVPRRGSIELFDHGGRGNRGAVYGTPYGLWSMWFAVIDRSKIDGSIRNGVFNFSVGSEILDVYNFSVHHGYLGEAIWRTGTLYLLPAETFQPIPFYPGGPSSNEWASTVELRPIARLEIRPEDFPFLDRVGGHDDSELIASDKLGEIVTEHIDAAHRIADGVAVHLRWDDEMAGIIEPYLESRRRFTPDVNRQHRIEPTGDHWIDVKGPDGFIQTYQQTLSKQGIEIQEAERNQVTSTGVEDVMRTGRLLGTSLTIALLMLTSLPAAAKGPGSATITGPGGTVEVSPGNYQYADEDPFWDLQSESGIFSLALMDGDEVGTRPTGDLGEPLIVTWELGNRDIVEFIYMNAEGGPVTRIEPDPAHGIRGGWHRPPAFGVIVSGTGLRTALEELGVVIPEPGPRSLFERILFALTVGMISKI